MTRFFGSLVLVFVLVLAAFILGTNSSSFAFAAASTNSWQIRSVSSMKETRDKICTPDNQVFINSWMARAKDLGANYVSIETPYDNPTCGDAVTYTKTWIDTARKYGLNIWHRHVPLGFEGLYSSTKINGDYYAFITSFIHSHPDFFANGDIFTPITEPQNGGIRGINSCDSGICQFSSAQAFNLWLITMMNKSRDAFSDIGLKDQIKVGYYGFDGYIAWGDGTNTSGYLYDATVLAMGNITIDHYPQLVGRTMKDGLEQLQARFPDVPIVIGEWGAVADTTAQKQITDNMLPARAANVIGFNYWHLGMGGNEALINPDFTKKPQFNLVSAMYQTVQ